MAVQLPDYRGTNFKFDNSPHVAAAGERTVGTIISQVLPYIYIVAGLSLLVMLALGGIGLMTAGGDPNKVNTSYGRIFGALIGFLIIFISYFAMQLVEVALGLEIL